MHQNVARLCVTVLAVIALTGCLQASGSTADEKRASVQQMRTETLGKLYALRPEARAQIRKAAGYGVFSNAGINVILFSAGSGWGIVKDNATGKDVYMKMLSGGIGLGLGVKDFRGVFVFTTREALTGFVEHGWDASAQADAAAKAGEQGAAYAGAIDVAPGIKLYQITESGLALQATIQGTKYWKDDELS